MLSFLIDAQAFMGAGQTTFANEGDQPPIAVDDSLSVLRNAGAVTVAVLGNDVDPEGQPLTLVSAFAAVGTAVAEPDGTVTYTPPQGPAAEFNDFDTVVYEVEDVNGARDTAQINVTISDADVTVATLANNTLTVTAGPGLIDITVTDPVEFAGTYTADLRDLDQGPINLVAPTISGDVTAGTTLTAAPGLWVYDIGAGAPSQSWQWQRGGIDIPGETGANYLVQAGDVGQPLSVIETQTDGFGSRAQSSNVLGSFSPASDTQTLGWWDAAETATITDNAGAVQIWAARDAGPDLVQTNAARRPTTGVRNVNGLNVIDFDGGDFLTQAVSLPASGDVAFHMALAIDTTANAFEAVLAVDATNDFQIDANSDTQFDGRINTAGIGAATNLAGGPYGGVMVLSVICDFTGAGQIEVFINDVSRGATAYTTPLDTAQTLNIMTNRAQNAWVNGAVLELVVSANPNTRSDYHAYLSSKWGLA